MSLIQLALNDVACSGCMGKIKKGIKRYNGIGKVKIIPGSGKIEISYNENLIQTDEINRTLHQLALRTFD